MEGNNFRRVADELVGVAGGYNLRTVIAAALAGLAIGFLLGGLLGRQFGFGFLLIPVVICLAVAGVVGFMKFQKSGGLGSLRGGRSAGQEGSFSSIPPPAFTPPVASPIELTELELQIMERVSQGDGSISVGALAEEFGVSRRSVRETIEDLANRGVISLD